MRPDNLADLWNCSMSHISINDLKKLQTIARSTGMTFPNAEVYNSDFGGDTIMSHKFQNFVKDHGVFTCQLQEEHLT